MSLKAEFARLLRACGSAGDLGAARLIHGRIASAGMDNHPYIANLLVQMYGKCGCVDEARHVFDHSTSRNSFSWTILMAACVQNGRTCDAKDALDRMPMWNVVAVTTMVAAFAGCGHLLQAKAAFDATPERNVVAWNAMLTGYAENGLLREARLVFDRIPHRSLASYNAMVQAYSEHGHLQEAKAVFDSAPERDVVTWTSMIEAYAHSGRLAEAKCLFFDAMARGKNVVTWTVLLLAAASSAVREAEITFDRMPQRSTVAWNAMVQAYAQNGRLDDARLTFDSSPSLNLVSWNAMVAAYAHAARPDAAKWTFSRMPLHSVVTWTAMLVAYSEAGRPSEAAEVFEAMPERNLVSWNAMVAAMAQNGRFYEARSIFEAMERRDVCSFNCLMQAYAEQGRVREAERIMGRMPQQNLLSCAAMALGYCRSGDMESAGAIGGSARGDMTVQNTVLTGFAENGRLEEAKAMFDAMPTRNALSWVAMLAGYACSGGGDGAVEVFAAMLLDGVQPCEAAFTRTLNACGRTGSVDLARGCFVSMVSDHGMAAALEHFCCLVDVLCKAGRMEMADELLLGPVRARRQPHCRLAAGQIVSLRRHLQALCRWLVDDRALMEEIHVEAKAGRFFGVPWPRLNDGLDYTEVISAESELLDYYARKHDRSAPREGWIKRIERGQIKVDGEVVTAPDLLVRAGAQLVYHRLPWQEPDAPCSLEILYEDEHLLGVNKPSGLQVLPGGLFQQRTVLTQLRWRMNSSGHSTPVHRLGRGTSGVLLCAKSSEAREALASKLADDTLNCSQDRLKSVSKVYRALVKGLPPDDEMVIDRPIGRVRYPGVKGGLYMAVEKGKLSLSKVRVLQRNREDNTAIVQVEIYSGRPHQIRIHLASVGHPLLGDPLYVEGGKPSAEIIHGCQVEAEGIAEDGGYERPVHALPGDCGYHLHAHKLSFDHPVTKERMEIVAPLPPTLTTSV